MSVDSRKVAVSMRLAKFAAHANLPPTSCPYSEGDEEGQALRRVWISTYLRWRHPDAGHISYEEEVAAAAREPTGDELASGVDFAGVAAEHDQAAADLAAQWENAAPEITGIITTAVVAALTAGGMAGLAELSPPAQAVSLLAGLLGGAMIGVADSTMTRVLGELRHLGFTISLTADQGVVEASAQLGAKLIASGLTNLAIRAATPHLGDQEAAQAAVTTEFEKVLGVANWIASSLGSALLGVEGATRLAAYDHLVATHGEKGLVFIASEVNDPHRCERCEEIDGTRFDSYAEARAAYPAGQYALCLGGSRCRGQLAVIREGTRNA